MEPTPPCEHCAQNEQLLKLAEQLDAAEEAYLQLLQKHVLLQKTYLAQREQRYRELSRKQR